MPSTLSEEAPLILGSASPRRRELLSALGIPSAVLPADIDESTTAGESPELYLERVVRAKLAAVLLRLGARPASAVLVADTSVTLGDDILGKPTDIADAVRMLARLCGREHRVLTRYALGWPDGRLACERTVSSRVWLRAASSDELGGYARTGEGLDKAGAYAVQGIGAFLVERIDGSYSNIVGLPLCELISDLTRVGLLERFP